MSLSDPRKVLEQGFAAAIASADPRRSMSAHLPVPPSHGRTIVVGGGKASAAMAQALEAHWNGPLEGIVVTRYGHAVPCSRIEIVEAAHPVPDAAGEAAARRMLEMVRGLTADDLVIALISGGGSALLSVPAAGLSLADKRSVNQALLRSGTTIAEMNCVRKHLSAIKGGQLAAAAWPARCHTLMISDVPGDDPAVIASGPTVADPTTFADAREILRRYSITPPEPVARFLDRAEQETPKPGDPRLSSASAQIIAAPQQSLEAAADLFRQAGYTPMILGDSLEGEAREVARVMAGITNQVLRHGEPVALPCALLSGGETTVTVRGNGRGGRNVEFLLALAIALRGQQGVWAIAGDTDGVDGAEEVAGAVIGPDTLTRAAQLGISASECLARNDGHRFFAALKDQVITGPTLTNVNDFRAILILQAPAVKRGT